MAQVAGAPENTGYGGSYSDIEVDTSSGGNGGNGGSGGGSGVGAGTSA